MILGSLAIISFLVSKRRVEDSAKLFLSQFWLSRHKGCWGLKHVERERDISAKISPTLTHTYIQTSAVS